MIKNKKNTVCVQYLYYIKGKIFFLLLINYHVQIDKPEWMNIYNQEKQRDDLTKEMH